MRITYFLLSIAGIVPSTLWGQADVRRQLQQAFALQRQGYFDKVIMIVPWLVQSGSLTPLENDKPGLFLSVR